MAKNPPNPPDPPDEPEPVDPPPHRRRLIRPGSKPRYQDLSFDQRVENRLLKLSDLVDIPLERIEPHPLLQRDVNEDRAWEMSVSYDPYGSFGWVVEEDPTQPGHFRELIGQHRALGAKFLVKEGTYHDGDMVACAVRPYINDDDSVAFVRRMEALSRTHTAVEDWNQAVKGNHAYARPMDDEIRRHGLHVSNGHGQHVISNTDFLWTVSARYGWDPDTAVAYLGVTLTIIESAYPIPVDGIGFSHRTRWHSAILRSIFEVLALNDLDHVDIERLTRVLGVKPPDTWLREAEGARSLVGGERRPPLWTFIHHEICDIYNKGLPKKRKLR